MPMTPSDPGTCLTLGVCESLVKLTSFLNWLNEAKHQFTHAYMLAQAQPPPAHQVHTLLEAGLVPLLLNRQIFYFQPGQ